VATRLLVGAVPNAKGKGGNMAIQRERRGVATVNRPQISALPSTIHYAAARGHRLKVKRGRFSLGGLIGALLKFSLGAVQILCCSLRLFLKPLKFAKVKRMGLRRRTAKKRKRG